MSEPEPIASPEAAGADDAGKMSFFDHLTELRTRIVWSLIPAAVGLGIALYFTTNVMRFLSRHLKTDLVFTTPTEAFWTYMKVAMIMGIFFAMPVILWNVWAFVAPGLLPHERKFALPFVVLSTVCFAIGAAFALTVIIPFAVKFMVGYKTGNLLVQWTLNRYVDFVLKFTIAFGLVFELPLALTLGSRLGLVTPEFLGRNRKYAILLAFVAAAILTPTPDAFNQLLMAGPLILLYEVGILAARVFGRKRAPKAA